MKKEPKGYIAQKLKVFIDEFLSELEKEQDLKTRKLMFHKVLIVFLGIYSCFAEGEVHENSKNLMLHFLPSVKDIQRNEKLDSVIQDLVSHMYFAMNTAEDKESLIRMIIFKLICIYSALAVSDKDGEIKCHALGEKLSNNWIKTTPTAVALSVLKNRKKNSNLPFNECELLEELSFWNQKNGVVVFYGSIF